MTSAAEDAADLLHSTKNSEKHVKCIFTYNGLPYSLDVVFEDATFGNVVNEEEDDTPWPDRSLEVAAQAVMLLKMVKGSDHVSGGFRDLKGFKLEALVQWLHDKLSKEAGGGQPRLILIFSSVLSLFAGSWPHNASKQLCHIRDQVRGYTPHPTTLYL